MGMLYCDYEFLKKIHRWHSAVSFLSCDTSGSWVPAPFGASRPDNIIYHAILFVTVDARKASYRK